MKTFVRLLVVGMGCFAAAAFGEEKVKVGDETLTVPLPPGFVRLDGVNPEVDVFFNKLVSERNRLLMAVAIPEDVKKAKEKGPTEMKRYLVMQTHRRTENKTTSLTDFKATSKQMEKIGELIPLGVLEKSDHSIDFGIPSSRQVDEKAPDTVASGGSIVLVRGKVIYVYAYSGYKEKSDMIWVQGAVKAWREAVLEANPGGTPK
jgi:hypothetical protein